MLFEKDSVVGSCYDDPTTTTWVIKADGSAPPVELAAADQGAGLTNAWPRWAPFPQSRGATNEGLFWITMSSKRDFGVRLHNTGLFQRRCSARRRRPRRSG